MPDFLTSTFFKYFIVPLFTVGLNLFVKINSRNDNHKSFSKEDAAVGPQIAVTAIITFIIQTIATAQSKTLLAQSTITDPLKLQTEIIALQNAFILSLLVAFVLTFLLGVLSYVLRKFGWEKENKLTWFWGLIFPFAYGVGTLFFVVSWINN